jgi:hypothetical protein
LKDQQMVRLFSLIFVSLLFILSYSRIGHVWPS